ncbi:MAG: hypothetical protein ThorAB25_29320 [Candidatus Thorarchaeota archaeon AB_25]|nr:MAG: hypothetical protein ThorAB25_29320 [Candidatus Thorarchaeota archaeon AB_25]
MGHIFGSVFGMYLIMLWVILFVVIAELTGSLLLIALIIIATPIVFIPIQYKDLKQKYGILQQAGQVLKDSEALVDSNQIVTGITSYVFLVFDILRPVEISDGVKEKNEVEEVRKSLNETTRKVISEIVFQAFLIVLLLYNFLIPGMIAVLERGGPALLIFLFLGFIVVVLISRWFVFLYWRLLVRKWLRFYQGFIEWGEELERVFSSPSKDNSGGGV